MNKNRLVAFDITRAICVLWIVGVWHMQEYCGGIKTTSFIETINGELITESVLATFMFMSGFFIQKYKFEHLDDIKVFFMKRFQRFYILLLFSVVGMFCCSLIGIKSSIAIMTGLSSLLDNRPLTLWFFGMIILFYLLTPIIMWRNETAKCLLRAIVIYGCFHIYYRYIHSVDVRLFMYFPFYCMGLLIPQAKVNNWFTNRKCLVFAICTLCLITYVYTKETYAMLISGGVILTLVGFISSKSETISRILTVIAYSSMCAYLYHRIVYKILISIWVNHHAPVWYGVIMLTVLFLLSWSLQSIYDKKLVYKK